MSRKTQISEAELLQATRRRRSVVYLFTERVRVVAPAALVRALPAGAAPVEAAAFNVVLTFSDGPESRPKIA